MLCMNECEWKTPTGKGLSDVIIALNFQQNRGFFLLGSHFNPLKMMGFLRDENYKYLQYVNKFEEFTYGVSWFEEMSVETTVSC